MKSLCGTVSDCSRGAAWQESQETFEESGGNENPDSGTQVGYVTPLCELGKQTDKKCAFSNWRNWTKISPPG